MSEPLNIAKTDDQPLSISNPADVTALMVDSESNSMSIYDSRGEALFTYAHDPRIDHAIAAQKLTESGVPMVPFTSYTYDGQTKKNDPCYISAAAVNYIDGGTPNDDGTRNITVCVKGYGEMYARNRPQEEVDALLEAVRRVNPLLEYDPEKVHTSEYYPTPLYIVPTAVTQIKDRFSSFELIFGNKGVLEHVELAGVAHESVEDIARKILKEDQAREAGERQYHEPDELYAEAQRRLDQQMQIKADFAAAIARHGNMIAVCDTHGINYTRAQDISHTDFHDEKEGREDRYRLTVHFHRAAKPNYLYDITIAFPTAEKRHEADRKINAAIAAAKAPKP